MLATRNWTKQDWDQKLQSWKKLVKGISRDNMKDGLELARLTLSIATYPGSFEFCDPNLLYEVCKATLVEPNSSDFTGNFFKFFFVNNIVYFQQSIAKDTLLRTLTRIVSSANKDTPIYYAAYVCLKMFDNELKNTSILFNIVKNCIKLTSSLFNIIKNLSPRGLGEIYKRGFGKANANVSLNLDELTELKLQLLERYDEMVKKANEGREISADKNITPLRTWQTLALAAENNIEPYKFEVIAALKFNSDVILRPLQRNSQSNEVIHNKLDKLYFKKIVSLLKSSGFGYASVNLMDILLPQLTCQKDLEENHSHALIACVFDSGLAKELDKARHNLRGDGLKAIATIFKREAIKEITEIVDVTVKMSSKDLILIFKSSPQPSGKEEITSADSEVIKLKTEDVLNIIVKILNDHLNKKFNDNKSKNFIMARIIANNQIQIILGYYNNKFITDAITSIETSLMSNYSKLKYESQKESSIRDEIIGREDTYVEEKKSYYAKTPKPKQGFNNNNINTNIEINAQQNKI